MTFRDLIGFARPWRGRLALIVLLQSLESAALLSVPWLAGRLAGDLLAAEAPPVLPLALGLLAALLALAILRGIVALISGDTSLHLLAALRRRLHDHLQSLPLPFHEDHKQGDLLALSTWEIGRLSGFLTGTLVGLLPLALTAAGAVVLMARIDLALALVVPLLVPVFYLVLKVVGRRLRTLGQAVQQAEAETVATAEDHLGMLPAIKSFTRERQASDRYAAAVEASRALQRREVAIYAVLGPATQFVAAAAAVLLLVLAGQGLRDQAMTAGELVTFLLYAGLLTRPVAQLANVYGQVQALRGTLARLGRVLDTAPEPAAGRPLDRARGALRFEGVRFAYPGRAGTLSGIDLAIPAGQTLALTGPNGAGKTTLIALLLRHRAPEGGRILLDGQDIADLRLADLRRQIALVPQRPLLFNGTVAENIGFGHPEATPDRIATAARLAQAEEFITALPDGYATVIGDHGVRLSGGQGQRLALARALIKDAPILVFDEATSMFDTAGESAFVAGAAEALRDRTVILITHRPATLALADRVIRLEDGRIVADTLKAVA